MNSTRITYTPRSDATPEAEASALAKIVKFVLDCHAKRKAVDPAPEPDSCNDGAIVRSTEEVSYVDLRPN